MKKTLEQIGRYAVLGLFYGAIALAWLWWVVVIVSAIEGHNILQ